MLNIKSDISIHYILNKVLKNERITEDEALFLLNNVDILTLGRLADIIKRKKHQDVVTFVVDRNINYTNICVAGCKFCAFQTTKKSPNAYILDFTEIFRKIEELINWGGTTVLMQGGLNPELRLDFYVNLFKEIKKRFPSIQIHSLSATEIKFISKLENLSVEEILRTLKEAGLDSLPGGGAEILSDEIRNQLSTRAKVSTQDWLEIHSIAHKLGMKSTATMMFGHIEKPEHIVEHLSHIRELQDRSLKENKGHFTAFIPWTFQKGGTKLDHIDTATTSYYLKVLSVSRIFLDNFDNIQSSHITQTMKVGQVALHFGANDLGSTMIEENVVASTGWKVSAPKPKKMASIIKEAGFKPAQRDTYYNIVRYF